MAAVECVDRGQGPGAPAIGESRCQTVVRKSGMQQATDARASASPSSRFEVHWTLARQRDKADGGQRTHQSGDSYPAAVPSDACWLISLQLMAVQPACLRAHPSTPVPQPQIQHNQQDLQHGLLLHLEAVLLAQAAHVAPPTAQEQSAVGSVCPPTPLQLSNVELQLVLLSRQMQVIQQQQFSLVQLIQQQQHQQLAQQQPVVLPSPLMTSTAANEGSSTGDREPLGGALVGQASSSSTETAASPAAYTPGTSSSWSLALNLHVSLPCRPTNRLLDALHLVLTVAGTPAQQPQPESSSAVHSSFPCDPGDLASSSAAQSQQQPSLAGLVAEVPLLVFPAVGQQEVQQLLLPAMRQEVQAEQQQQQHHQGLTELGPERFAAQILQVEYAAWRHYCQLANDIFTVMELSVAAEAEAAVAAAAAAASAHSQSPPAAAQQPLSSVAVVPPPSASAGAAEPLFPAASTAALGEIAETLLFPLLLPFLAAHGLHHVLQLLVACLPLHLQQQWQQQQEARLQHLSLAAPPALQLPVVVEFEEQQEKATPRADAEMEVDAPAAAASTAMEGLGMSQHQHGLASVGAQQRQAVQTGGGAAAAQQQQEGRTSTPGSWEMPGSPRKPAKQAAAADSTSGPSDGASAVLAPDIHVTWLTPLLLFEGSMEHRYLVWKHHSLIHLDYLCALFDIMYLAVLVKRMISEPATLWYFMYILIKTLPHVPLMLGLREPFLRFEPCRCGTPGCSAASDALVPWYREFWLFMVGPALVVLTVGLTIASRIRGQPTVLLPARVNTAFLASRAELVTSSMRPFMQHMRLPLYIVFCLIDAAVAAWVAGQFLDAWTAIKRWGVAALLSIALCWMFELVLRRCFVAREQRQGMQQRQVSSGAAVAATAKGSAGTSSKAGLLEGSSEDAELMHHSSKPGAGVGAAGRTNNNSSSMCKCSARQNSA